MTDASAIRVNMEVISADGVHVGVVDQIEGGRMRLTGHDRAAGGKQHYLDTSHVADVEGDKVRLGFISELVTQFWDEA